MSKLSREDIISKVYRQYSLPKPKKIDPFGRVLEWEGETASPGLLGERAGRYAACMPKDYPNDIEATLAAWATFASEMVKAVPVMLKRAAEKFHKEVEKEFMHSVVYDDRRDSEGDLHEELLDEARKGRLKKPLKLKNGDEIPSGTAVEVRFDNHNPEMALLKINYTTDNRDYMVDPIRINAGKLYLYVSGFGKPPSISTMMKWNDDGVAKTVTGKRVEPDGVGPDGSPSWLRVLGYV